jgi:hypothetical protein
MLRPKPKSPEEKPLDERILSLRDECDAFIDKRVKELKIESPGVPEGVLRNILMARTGGNVFQAALNVMEQLQ